MGCEQMLSSAEELVHVKVQYKLQEELADKGCRWFRGTCHPEKYLAIGAMSGRANPNP